MCVYMCTYALAAGFPSIDVDGRVVRVDTFAKLLGPGYRLGWVSGPPEVVQKLSLHFAAVSVGSCSLSQVGPGWARWDWWGQVGQPRPDEPGLMGQVVSVSVVPSQVWRMGFTNIANTWWCRP
jgi:hypothetical protein